MDLKYIMLSERNQTQNIVTDPKLQVHGFPTRLSLAEEVTLWVPKHTGGQKFLLNGGVCKVWLPGESKLALRRSHAVFDQRVGLNMTYWFSRGITHTPTSVNIAKAPNFYFKI